MSDPLTDFLTLRDISRQLGVGYSTAHSLGMSGLFGEPVILGRTHFFPRAAADRGIARRRTQIAARGRRAPVFGVG